MSRRKTSGNVDGSEVLTSSNPAKRQRVSLACDSCRAAKAKCDGDDPCGTCAAQNKSCAYTHTARKRGMPSGYLRSMELSLAWLFDNFPGSEAALHRQLTKNNRADGIRMLASADGAAARLNVQWNRSSIPTDISNILADPKSRPDATLPHVETQASDNPGDILPQMASVPHSPSSPICSHRLALPQHWERLVDVYFNYTSCWFPIVERRQIMAAASRYPPGGLLVGSDKCCAADAQLWAVLALGSFHNAASDQPIIDVGLSLDEIYSVACHLSLLDPEACHLPRIRAFLLRSLVLLGQQKTAEAWALIGMASRLASSVASTSDQPTQEKGQQSMDSQISRVLEASFILDTMATLCLGHTEGPGSIHFGPLSSTSAQFLPTQQIRNPAYESTQVIDRGVSASSQSPAQPLAIFQQLYKFCQLWVRSKSAGRQATSPGQKLTTQDVLQSLDAQFSFCNSLLLETSKLNPPSTFLVQAMFLAISLDLSSGPRPALLFNLLDLTESYIKHSGPFSISPLAITLMSVVHRHGHTDRMYQEERLRWNTAFKSLRQVWRPGASRTGAPITTISTRNNGDPSCNAGVSVTIGVGASSISLPSLSRDDSNTQCLGILPEETIMFPPLSAQQSPSEGKNVHRPSPSLRRAMPLSVSPRLSTHRNLDDVPVNGISALSHEVADYDRILDELGSIDYVDAIDADSQFMTNLGFEPGCDLGEMFLSGFSV